MIVQFAPPHGVHRDKITAAIIAGNGGKNPPCPDCGKPMSPVDNFGGFSCRCDGSSKPDPKLIGEQEAFRFGQ